MRSRLILMAAGFAVALAVVAYIYSDALIEFVQSLAGGKLRVQGHIRY
jgi:hypothetical protein